MLFLGYIHTRVSKGRDVPLDVPGQSGTGRPFVPGQKKFPCPAVPLSRDKSILSCWKTYCKPEKNPGAKTEKKIRVDDTNTFIGTYTLITI